MKRNEVTIRITYETITEESAEDGCAADSGWIDEEGTTYTLREAVHFLKSEGIGGASCYPLTAANAAHAWLHGYDSEDFATGETTAQAYHLTGDLRAKLAIFKALGLVK